MKLYAVTAAGGPTSVPLARLTGQTWEALVPVPSGSREGESSTCLERVVEAIAQTEVSHQIVVAPPAVREALPNLEVEWVESGPVGSENFLAGLRRATSADRVLWTACDLPLASGTGLKDFLSRCDQRLELNYAVTSYREMEKVFPGYDRRYIPLKEGRFTGGGVAMINPFPVLTRQEHWKAIFGSRKNSFKVALRMGWPVLWGRLTGGLGKAEVERAFCNMVKMRCQALEVDPRWALDLDSPDDLHYLRWWVRRFPERA